MQQLYYNMSKLSFIVLVCLSLSIHLAVSQEYIRLDKSSYALHLSEYPKDTIRILEKGKPTKLKRGKYIVQNNQFMGPSNAFVSINEDGIVDGDFKIEKEGKRGVVLVRHGVMQKMDVKSAELLDFQYGITDTSSVQRDFRKGKITQEKIVFYNPRYGKKKVTKVFWNNYYTIENDFDHSRSNYRLDNKLIYKAKLSCGGQVVESKSYDKNGQLVKHTYKKNNIDYIDLFQDNNLVERSYRLNDMFYHEYFRNALLVKKVVGKVNKGNMEVNVYNGDGKLIEKNADI